jgi:hypothetical protein
LQLVCELAYTYLVGGRPRRVCAVSAPPRRYYLYRPFIVANVRVAPFPPTYLLTGIAAVGFSQRQSQNRVASTCPATWKATCTDSSPCGLHPPRTSNSPIPPPELCATHMAMLLVTRLVTGLALDRAALPAMRGTTRALRLHSPVLQARSPVTVAAGAVEVTTAVPLTTATFAASDAAASEWSGDMMIVPLWQADKGERPTLGPSAQALDDKLAGLRAPSPSPYPYPYPRRLRPAP